MTFSMQGPAYWTGRFLEVFNSIHMNKANKAQIAKDSGWAILYRCDSAVVSRLIASVGVVLEGNHHVYATVQARG
jgi:hypothetical protein